MLARSAALLCTLVLALLFAVTLLVPAEAHAQCSVCDPCTSDADCGAGGVCVSFGDGSAICSRDCSQSVCPGDSRCFQVPSGTTTYNLCLNPGAANPSIGLCPAAYQCATTRSCPSAGTSCANGIAACGIDAEACPSDANGFPFCTCFCTSHFDCGPSGSCVGLQNDPRGVCIPSQNPGPCTGVTCPQGQVCDPGTGNCISDANDLCAGVVCPGGGICSPATGTCIGGSSDVSTADTTDLSAPADTTPPTTAAPDVTSTPDTTAADTTPGSATDVTPQLEPLDDDCSCRVLRAPVPRSTPGAVLLLVAGALLALRRSRCARR